ncbi:MAG: hypothetical protein WC712_07790 [Candidatus Brocadiia bacterium]
MVRLVRASKKKLGEILMEEGLLTQDQVEKILKEQRETGERFGDLLIDHAIVDQYDIAKAVVTQFHLPFIHLHNVEVNPNVKGIFTEAILNRNQFVPFDLVGDILLIAIFGPMDAEILEQLEQASGKQIRVFVSTITEIRKVITEQFTEKSEVSSLGQMLGIGG